MLAMALVQSINMPTNIIIFYFWLDDNIRPTVTQSFDFYATRKDFLSSFHQHFRRCTACGHQADNDIMQIFRQHVPAGFRAFFRAVAAMSNETALRPK